MGRLATSIGLIAAVLAILLGSWFASGWSAVRREQDGLRASVRASAQRDGEDLVADLERRLHDLAGREDARAWYQYRALYHDPRGAYAGNAIAPSPLSARPEDPLVSTYFEIEPDGAVTLPGYTPGLQDLSYLSGDQAERYQLALARLGASLPARISDVARVETLETNAYAQNINATDVYQSPNTPQPEAAAPVTITIGTFEPQTLGLGDASALAMVRQVLTPDGVIAQGFVIERAAVAATVHDGRVALDDGAGALGFGPWHLTVDAGAALAVAQTEADGLEHDFLYRFIPTAALAILCGVMVIVLVARAERAAEQRAAFAAAAAHELRTPLAGLQLYGDMLAGGLGNPERSGDYARRVAEEAARLGRVVSNVLDFSRLERGNLSVADREIDAVAAVKAAAERARASLERAGASLQLETPDAPLLAHLDDDALARVLGNLLDNAEKYSRDAADRTIMVTVARAGDRVEIAISDHGAPVADPKALFRPFSRGVAADGPPGLGLGLALARSLARAMGGELAYRESPKAFVVSLRA